MENSENTIIVNKLSQEIIRLLSFSVDQIKFLQKNESLTPDGLSKTQLVKNISLNNIHLVKIIDQIVSDSFQKTKKVIINIYSFLKETVDTLNNLISGYNGFEIKFEQKDAKDMIIYHDPYELEFCIYNIISILMENLKTEPQKTVKISLSRTHAPGAIATITFSVKSTTFNYSHMDLFMTNEAISAHSDLSEISIWATKNHIEQSHGTIEFKKTKLFNKFIVTLPQDIPIDYAPSSHVMESPILGNAYMPNIYLANAILGKFLSELDRL